MMRLAAIPLGFLASLLAATSPARLEIVGVPRIFAPGIASTAHSEIRLTLSVDGRTALWFSRDRPGGPGGYDIWVSRRTGAGWRPAEPAPFNSPGRDFDPAFSADGRTVFFSSDRSGGEGGDDIWRAAVTAEGFGPPEPLGAAINGPGDEWAPMPAPGGDRLLFSSDRPGGAGGHDLYVARRAGRGFAPGRALAGAVNGPAHEFDGAFLADGETIVFARTEDFRTGRVRLFTEAADEGRYGPGTPIEALDDGEDAYGAMLDWSRPDRLIFTGRRRVGGGLDLFLVRYRLRGPAED